MSEVKVDLEGMRKRALSVPRSAPGLAADVLALSKEVERLRDRNDALLGEATGAKEHAAAVGRSHTEALRLLGEANAEIERMREASAVRSRTISETMKANDDLNTEVLRLGLDNERLRDAADVQRGALAEQSKDYVDVRAKVGVLLGEVADTAVAFGMMAPDMRDAIDGPNAIQFLQHIRAWFVEHLGAEERLATKIERWRPVVDAAKQWWATLAKSDMSPHKAREALAHAVIALGDD